MRPHSTNVRTLQDYQWVVEATIAMQSVQYLHNLICKKAGDSAKAKTRGTYLAAWPVAVDVPACTATGL